MVEKVAAKAALMAAECQAQIKYGRRQLDWNSQSKGKKNIKYGKGILYLSINLIALHVYYCCKVRGI